MDNLSVNCYSGHTYAQRPVSFRYKNTNYRVEQIIKTWQQPGSRYFQVRTDCHKAFQLCYNETNDQWSLIELAGGKHDG